MQARRALRGAPVSFWPPQLAGLVLWLDAAQITGLADAAAVSAWSDISGQANHATQATGAKQPLYKVNIVNGRPVVRFDPTDDYLQTAAFTGGIIAQPLTMLLVGTAPQTTNAQLFDGRDITNRMAMSDSGAHKFQLYAGSFLTTGALANNAGFHVHAVAWDATDTHYLDGVIGATGDAGANSLAGITLGARYDGAAGFLGGDMAEVLIYNRALSSTERRQAERYLGRKYGISVT